MCCRKMPLWKVPVGNLTKHPPGKVLAEGAAAYNGSFHPLQVPGPAWLNQLQTR